MENGVDRLGMSAGPRVLVMAGLASTFGLFYGIGKGAKISSLRYLAENAHRLPRTKGTWYFFHKRKNYVVLKDGMNRGMAVGLKYGSVTALFFGIEAMVDQYSHKVSWISTTAAATGSGIIVSSLQRLPIRQVLRSVRNFTIVGALIGLIQDRVREKSHLSRVMRSEQQENS